MTEVLNRYASYPAERVIPFTGPRNFRDMGGYPAADGRKVKYGILFRADELTDLSADDIAFLESLNIRTVFDYRGNDEAELKPDPVLNGAINVRIPAIPDLEYRSHHDMAEMMKQFTASTLDNMYGALPINNPSYKKLIELLADPERLGLIHHCAAGKDRTGVGSALILTLLGVPKEIVMQDYLITNITMAGFKDAMMAGLAEKVSAEDFETIGKLMDAREEFLESAFRAIEQTYGSMEVYFEQEFGLTGDKISTIRGYCLE